MDALNSLLGIVVLLLIAFLLSSNKKAINYRTVLGALGLQVGLGALILYVPAGRHVLQALADGVNNVIGYGFEGIKFVFGGLASDKIFEVMGGDGFIFAVRVLPSIVFFSALISLLYYIGVMQWIIKIIGGGLQKLLGTSKAESMSAVMAGGLASIAGSVMAGYAGMGVPLTYLIAASFMAAPAGLLFAKILVPQTEQFNDDMAKVEMEQPANILDAAAAGAGAGMQLALNVGAMLIAFVALIALLNGILGGIGGWIGMSELSLGMLFGYIFRPLAWVIGVPWEEAHIAGQMIGTKLAINEFVGYLEFSKYLSPESAIQLTDKTKAIITFALCGFANFSSIAILIGGLGGMAPNRRGDIARLGIKAVIAGSLANLMSATIAGLFIGLGGSIA